MSVIFSLEAEPSLSRETLLHWLREKDPSALETLWRHADETRKAHVGDEVHLRGLLEISNHCVRSCGYCGIAAYREGLTRYRMTAEEIRDGARLAAEVGCGTVVMQSGEDYGLTREFVAEAVRFVKGDVGLAVTLSLGERPEGDLEAWREAGADRYLLRFETSDAELYERIHPSLPGRHSDRFAQLRQLRRLGYEAGSGVMVGIPGQSLESLAEDLLAFCELDLDMIGIGPYIADPATPLGKSLASLGEEQAPASEELVLKMVALARLVRPDANLPATTALATMDRAQGRELGLTRGANILMPNLTPAKYRRLYAIYPDKAGADQGPTQTVEGIKAKILALGRTVGHGPGGRASTRS